MTTLRLSLNPCEKILGRSYKFYDDVGGASKGETTCLSAGLHPVKIGNRLCQNAKPESLQLLSHTLESRRVHTIGRTIERPAPSYPEGRGLSRGGR